LSNYSKDTITKMMSKLVLMAMLGVESVGGIQIAGVDMIGGENTVKLMNLLMKTQGGCKHVIGAPCHQAANGDDDDDDNDDDNGNATS